MHAPLEETKMEDEDQTANEVDPFIQQVPSSLK
jgi:hypothetical protein